MKMQTPKGSTKKYKNKNIKILKTDTNVDNCSWWKTTKVVFDEKFTLERKMWKITDVYFRDQEKNLTCNDMLEERDVSERERKRESDEIFVWFTQRQTLLR